MLCICKGLQSENRDISDVNQKVYNVEKEDAIVQVDGSLPRSPFTLSTNTG